MNITFSEYFQRQTLLPEIGNKGLERLRKTRVAVAGVGGVGAAAAEYLARSGIGFLRLIDQDIVEPSNLHRLSGVGQEHLYHSKAEVVAGTIARSNPWISLEPVVETLRPNNVAELLEGMDLVVDGLDNFRTRYYLNNHSLERRIPYIFASAIAAQGHVSVFAPPETPCLECLFPGVVDRPEDSCETLGIVPTAVGVVAAIAASESVKVLLGLPTLLKGGLLTVDMMGPDFLLSLVKRRDSCETCNASKKARNAPEGTLTILCGEKTFNVMPRRPLSLDLRMISQSVPHDGILAATNSLLVYRMGELVVSLFKTGRLLIKGAGGEGDALSIASEVWRRVSTEGPALREVV